MLFKKLFNWIKFKTLPSSVLFKNRLFIERDSKHRRVMSNFGLTYRNSKWSDYALTNVSMKSKTSFLRTLQQVFLLCFILFVLVRGFKFYNTDLLNNEISFILWTLVDDTTYGLCFVVWSVLFFIKSSITMLYQRLFSVFYKVESNYEVSNVSNSDVQSINLPKGSQKLVFYSWLTNNPRDSHSDLALENLYSPASTGIWSIGSSLFKNLYKTSSSIHSCDSITSSFNVSPLLHADSQAFNLVFNSNSLKNSVTLQSDLHNGISTTRTPLTLNSLINRTKWNIYSIESESDAYNPYIKSVKGLFYMYDTNFNHLSNLTINNPELASLMTSVTDQNKMFKWNRWLYRYNILHRKVMKNAHKTTLAKKLISTGFLDSSLTDRNLWASDFFSNRKKSTRLIATNFNNLYGATLGLNNTNFQIATSLNSFSATNTLNLLDTYEDSYFFFLKRFYMFNTMVTNKISSSVSLQNELSKSLASDVADTENMVNYHQTVISNLIKSSKLTNQYFDPSKVLEASETYSFDGRSSEPAFKDLAILNADYDLLNIDNLELLSNLSNSLLSRNYQFHYFSSLNYNSQDMKLSLTFNPTNNNDNLSLTSFYPKTDTSLLSDVYTLLFFVYFK